MGGAALRSQGSKNKVVHAVGIAPASSEELAVSEDLSEMDAGLLSDANMSDGSDSDVGEIGARLLDGSLAPEEWALPGALVPPSGGASSSTDSVYGRPLSAVEVAAKLPRGSGGLVWRALLVGDEWQDATLCLADGTMRPRRAVPPVRSSDFFSSLVKMAEGRWAFSGVLNGWPGLTCLELLRLTTRRGKVLGRSKHVRIWDAEKNPEGLEPPRVAASESWHMTLRMAAWTKSGWSESSPYYAWWFLRLDPEKPSVVFGDEMIRNLRQSLNTSESDMPIATNVHLFAHRYALGEGRREGPKDLVTYHSAILLEWDHGLHTSVVELANLNGVGGRHGRCNWCADRDQLVPELLRAMPPVLVAPFNVKLAEIRCVDVPARSLDEFKEYVQSFTGPSKRFLDPHYQHSGPVRLGHRTQEDIMRCVLNYMARDQIYAEDSRNCQTFAADFYGYLAGKKGIEPFSMVCRVKYKPRHHLFPYDPAMYSSSR